MATTVAPDKGMPVAKNVALYTSDTGLGAGTVTSSDILVDTYSSADFLIDATIAGAAPTLNVYIQKKGPNGNYSDIVSFTQLTATGKKWVTFLPAAATADGAVQDAGLAAGSVLKTNLGQVLRIKAVFGGTISGSAVNVWGDFYR